LSGSTALWPEFSDINAVAFRTGDVAHLIAANALKGYEDFTTIAVYVAEPQSIHTRRPVASLDDLKGMKIRPTVRYKVPRSKSSACRPS
jgi:TRAP-type C4-dicarboxylate transport system substrate-binding protein